MNQDKENVIPSGSSTVRFTVEMKNQVVSRVGRGWMEVPEIKFQGGEIKWYQDEVGVEKIRK